MSAFLNDPEVKQTEQVKTYKGLYLYCICVVDSLSESLLLSLQ